MNLHTAQNEIKNPPTTDFSYAAIGALVVVVVSLLAVAILV